MMKGRISEGIYPNSPLVEVVCEVRFEPRLEVEAGRAAFWEKIRGAFPKLALSAGTPSCPPCAQPCRFESVDGSAGVLLGISQCAYYQKQYSGHRAFIAEFMRHASAAVKQFGIQDLERLGWRYINLIPLVRKADGSAPLSDFILFPVKLPKELAGPIHHESLSLRSPFEDGMQILKVEVVQGPDGNESLLLDIDIAISGPRRITRLSWAVQQAHRRASLIFEVLIQDRYREYLKGVPK